MLVPVDILSQAAPPVKGRCMVAEPGNQVRGPFAPHLCSRSPSLVVLPQWPCSTLR